MPNQTDKEGCCGVDEGGLEEKEREVQTLVALATAVATAEPVALESGVLVPSELLQAALRRMVEYFLKSAFIKGVSPCLLCLISGISSLVLRCVSYCNVTGVRLAVLFSFLAHL